MTSKPMKIVGRERMEAYSQTVAVRVRPSEKKTLTAYARKRGVTRDAVLRSALVAAGVLKGEG